MSTAGSTPWLSIHGQNLDDQHIQLHRSSEGIGAASGDCDSLTQVYYSSLNYQKLRGRGGNVAMQRTLYSRFTRVRLCTKSKQLTDDEDACIGRSPSIPFPFTIFHPLK